MDEIVVRVLRAVACAARLRILSKLAHQPEASPTALAHQLGISVDLVCAHLARLSSVGLIRRRRSGAWCYCVAESPYPEEALSGKVASWLRRWLTPSKRGVENSGVVQLRNSFPPDPEGQRQNLLFDAATAFTNVRRVQILRHLARGEVVDVETLSRQLSMSGAAVSRHTNKLIRRGYVGVSRRGRSRFFGLAEKFRTPAHAELFDIVMGTGPTK